MSSHPLMGFASVHLTISSNVTGLSIGVAEPGKNGRTFFRIPNLHRPDSTWELGVNELSWRSFRIQAGAGCAGIMPFRLCSDLCDAQLNNYVGGAEAKLKRA